MIRSSALLTAVAMAVLVAGVVSASLVLIYLSIAVSILAAITLGVGVLLRRRELFGDAGAGGTQRGWAAADQAGLRPAVAGSTGTGSARWPGAIAAKGGPSPARRGDEHSAAHPGSRERSKRSAATGSGPGAREPAARTPAPREPAPREPAPREPAPREPARNDWARTERDRSGRDRGRGPARDRDAAARAGRAQAETEHGTAARGHRDRQTRGRDRERAAAGEPAEDFRLPPPGDRVAGAWDDAARRQPQGERGRGEKFWDRANEETPGGEGPDPGRPAWPAAAGSWAMDVGGAATHRPAGPGHDEPEPAWSSRHGGPAPRDRAETSPTPARPDERPGEDERPAAEPEEPRWNRMVPRYVDDLAWPAQGREPAGAGRTPGGHETAGKDSGPAEQSAPAEAAAETAGRDVGSGWSAWSSARSGRTPDQPAQTGRDRDHPAPGDDTGDDRDTRTAAGSGAVEWNEAESVLPEGGPAEAGGAQTVLAGRGAAPGSGAPDDGTSADRTGADRTGADRTGADRTGATLMGTVAAVDGAADSAGDVERHVDGPDTAGADQAGGASAAGDHSLGDHAAEGDSAAGADLAAGAGGPGGSDDAEAAGEEDGAAEDGQAGDDDVGGAPLDDEVTIVPGVARYHRRGCILIRFLSDGDLEIMTRREAVATGVVPCKACQPDKPGASA